MVLDHGFRQFLRAQYWQQFFLPPVKMAANEKFASLERRELDI